MEGPRAPVLSSSKPPTMLETQFSNSTATTGTVAFLKFAWTDLPTPWEVVSAAVEALEAAEASVEVSVVVEALAVAAASVEVVAASAVAMEVATVAALALELLAVLAVPHTVALRLRPWLLMPSLTSRPLMVRGARSSSSAT